MESVPLTVKLDVVNNRGYLAKITRYIVMDNNEVKDFIKFFDRLLTTLDRKSDNYSRYKYDIYASVCKENELLYDYKVTLNKNHYRNLLKWLFNSYIEDVFVTLNKIVEGFKKGDLDIDVISLAPNSWLHKLIRKNVKILPKELIKVLKILMLVDKHRKGLVERVTFELIKRGKLYTFGTVRKMLKVLDMIGIIKDFRYPSSKGIIDFEDIAFKILEEGDIDGENEEGKDTR